MVCVACGKGGTQEMAERKLPDHLPGHCCCVFLVSGASVYCIASASTGRYHTSASARLLSWPLLSLAEEREVPALQKYVCTS